SPQNGAQKPWWNVEHRVFAMTLKYSRTFWLFVIPFGILMTAVAPVKAESEPEWAEWTYRWGQLSIVIRTNVGEFSPSLQALGMDNIIGTEGIDGTKLMSLANQYLRMSSEVRLDVDPNFDFIEPLARKWGPGHSLPILAAVVVQNVQRPVSTLFG